MKTTIKDVIFARNEVEMRIKLIDLTNEVSEELKDLDKKRKGKGMDCIIAESKYFLLNKIMGWENK